MGAGFITARLGVYVIAGTPYGIKSSEFNGHLGFWIRDGLVIS